MCKGRESSLQDATSVHKDISLLMDQLVVTILDLNIPFAFGFVPCCTIDRMLVFDVPVAVIFLGDIVHVGMDLLRCSIVVGPLRIGCEAESIVVSWNVAFALRDVRLAIRKRRNQIVLPRDTCLVVCQSTFAT